MNINKNKTAKVLSVLKNRQAIQEMQENRDIPLEFLVFEKSSTEQIKTYLNELEYSSEFYNNFNNKAGVPLIAKGLLENNQNLIEALESIHGSISYNFPCNKNTI